MWYPGLYFKEFSFKEKIMGKISLKNIMENVIISQVFGIIPKSNSSFFVLSAGILRCAKDSGGNSDYYLDQA